MDSGLLIDVDIDWGIDLRSTSTLSVACFVHHLFAMRLGSSRQL